MLATSLMNDATTRLTALRSNTGVNYSRASLIIPSNRSVTSFWMRPSASFSSGKIVYADASASSTASGSSFTCERLASTRRSRMLAICEKFTWSAEPAVNAEHDSPYWNDLAFGLLYEATERDETKRVWSAGGGEAWSQ